MTAQFNFTNRRVLVTGGGRGLGLGIAKRFLEAGATVAIIDNDEGLLQKVKEEHPSVETYKVNLMNWEETKNAVQNMECVHHLVNNAGTGRPAETFLEMKPESIDQIFNLNFKAMVNVSQTVARRIIENKIEGGTIVNVSSVSDVTAVAGLCTYGCSKAAVTCLTKSMAIELGEHGIRVNCIRPCMVRTEQVGTLAGNQSFVLQNVLRANSRKVLNRMVELTEIGDAVLFLSSSASGMTTGSDILLDGGMLSC